MDARLSLKEKNCVQRNHLIQKKAKDVDKGLASERNELERRMNIEAKKLLKRFTKTPETRQESDERRHEHLDRHPSPRLPGLPTIRHPAEELRSDEAVLPRSAPASPNTLKKRALQPLSHDGMKGTRSLIPPEQPLPGIRRGSCPDLEKFNQLGVPTTSRRGSSGSVGIQDQMNSVSPKMPRNLATRERARRESSLKDLEVAQAEVDTTLVTKPSLEEQFQALGSCRYLRSNSDS